MADPDELSTALQQVVDFSPKPEVVFRMVIASGADTGKSIVIDGSSEILIGQSPACALQLTDATVSRRHIACEVTGAKLRLRDLGSSNGTYLGNVQLVEALLTGGETIDIGTTKIRVDIENTARPAPATTRIQFGSLFGPSREMRRLYPLLERLAASNVPVLIEGETGTGKEVVAEALHTESARAGGPYVVFDCTAVSPSLVESELFGHERGAFTGASAQRKGIFEQAHGGTLFIDEIGDLPADLQPKLLRALERSEVRRVGGDKWIRCDVRVIAATRRDVERLVEEGKFRDDLFHRLAVGRLELPPLRRRKGDVLALAELFCNELGGNLRAIPGAVVQEWQTRAWPGNVRELRNAVSRELALGDLSRASLSTGETPVADLGANHAEFDAVIQQGLSFPEARQIVLDAFQRRYLEHMIVVHGGNLERAAQAAGVSSRYLRMLRARSR